MKISATQYARALYETTTEKPAAEVDLMVENFMRILEKNNQTKLAGSIVEKFSAIHNNDNGIVVATVVSAEILNRDVLKNVEDFIAKKYTAKEVILTQEIEKKIRGGIIIKVGDEMIDASVVKKINNLKMALIK